MKIYYYLFLVIFFFFHHLNFILKIWSYAYVYDPFHLGMRIEISSS